METNVRFSLQNAEFDALTKLAEAWRILQHVAVVDDDYPDYRHKYEQALRAFIAAWLANGRGEDGRIEDAAMAIAQVREQNGAAPYEGWVAILGERHAKRAREELWEEARAAYAAIVKR